MSKSNRKAVIGGPAVTNVVFEPVPGKVCSLEFTFGSLIAAERELAKLGQSVNMLQVMDTRGLGAERLPILFYASLLSSQPDITLEEATALIRMDNFFLVYEMVVQAYLLSCVPLKPKSKDGQPGPPPVEAAPR